MSNTRPRRRVRSSAEQMFWDRLGVAERVAFTIGYAVGQGHPFPTPAMIEQLRAQIDPATARRSSGQGPGGRPRHRYDYAQVAAIARTAIVQGTSAARAVFEQIEACASVNAAGVAIVNARKLGHHIPYVRNTEAPAS